MNTFGTMRTITLGWDLKCSPEGVLRFLRSSARERQLNSRRPTAQCSRRAAVRWTGAEAPILPLCDGVTSVADHFFQRRLSGAATAAPRRFVARGGRAQLIGRVVGQTVSCLRVGPPGANCRIYRSLWSGIGANTKLT